MSYQEMFDKDFLKKIEDLDNETRDERDKLRNKINMITRLKFLDNKYEMENKRNELMNKLNQLSNKFHEKKNHLEIEYILNKLRED